MSEENEAPPRCLRGSLLDAVSGVATVDTVLLAHEIAEERSVEHLDRKVLAPGGEFVRVTHVYKTVPLEVWRLKSRSCDLECAASHLVVTRRGTIPADQIRNGDEVFTEDGWEPVLSVASLGVKRELFDLRVESEEHLYFTGGIASHNSTGLASSTLFKFNVVPRYRAIYITPLKEQSKTIADMMMDMQRGSIYPPEYLLSKGYRNNMYYKESPKGSSIKLMHILTDPSKVRGNSVPVVIIDECSATGTNISIFDPSGKKVVLEIEKLKSGDRILAHDKHRQIVVDTVVGVRNKGIRPTWTLKLKGGQSLTCTSNEKLRTTQGWIFLSQLLPPSEVARCDRAKQIHAAIARAEGAHPGELARGPFGADGGLHTPTCGDDSRSEARSVSEPQSQRPASVCVNSPSMEGEQRLWGVELRRFDIHSPGFRILVSPVLPRYIGRSVEEDCHPGLGGHVDDAGPGVLVHGRRHITGQVRPLHDAQLHATGVRDTGCETARDGLRRRGDETHEEEQQDLPPGRHSDGRLQEVSARHTPLRAREYALQVGADRELPRVSLLPRGVRNESRGQGVNANSVHLLHKSHVQTPDAEGSKSQTRRTTDRAPTAYECAIARSESRDAKRRTQDSRQSRARSPICDERGSREIQRDAKSLAEKPESAEHRRETASDPRLPLLQKGVPEQPYAQDVPQESVHQLPGVGVHDQETGGLQGLAESESQGAMGLEGASLIEDEIVSITYAGEQEVWDIETEEHHTFFAGGIAVHNCQDFDPEHLPEIEQVQKSFRDTRTTVFAGTSKDLDTCLEAQYRVGSRGVWHIPCGCPKKWHSMDPDNREDIKAMISVDGLQCPDTAGKLLNPMAGEFVHADRSKLLLNMPSFHLPQVIVPEYAIGGGFSDIYRDFHRYSFKKFLQEVWGLAVESGLTELSENDLKKCCTTKTFAQTQKDYLSGKVRYVKVISGVDWGGSDWEPAYRSKLSYTVHTIYGMRGDGSMDLIYAEQYSGMNYRDIAGQIVAAHNKFKAFAMGTDNGGGAYYNAYMRDCGRIPTNLIIHFQYTDTKLMLDRIPHPEAHIMSLHRSDSISALIADIKDQKISWPRWDESSRFVMHCLNVRRNITEAPSGRTILRYIKHGARADDFFMSTNYAAMMKRIINREPLIPNQQIIDQLRSLFGIAIPNDLASRMGNHIEGGYVSG